MPFLFLSSNWHQPSLIQGRDIVGKFRGCKVHSHGPKPTLSFLLQDRKEQWPGFGGALLFGNMGSFQSSLGHIE